MEVSCEKLHKNLVLSLLLSLSLRTLGTRGFSTLGQSSIFYQKNQTKGPSPKLLCFTYSSSINMHTIKDHSETQKKHHLRWKMFTKKEIRPVPLSTNFSNNHTASLVPNIVIYIEGKWGLKERRVIAYGDQEELVLLCRLPRDEENWV